MAHPPAASLESPLSAHAMARTPRSARLFARFVLVLLFVVPTSLAFVPWQQQVHGEGRAIAFNPVERSQFVVAPIQGRISRWAVVEGRPVKAGDLLVEMIDVDPLLPQRLQDEEFAVQAQQLFVQGAVAEVERRITGLELGLQNQLQEIEFRITSQEAAVAAAQLAVFAAEEPLRATEERLRNAKKANAATPNVVPAQDIIDLERSVTRQEKTIEQMRKNREQLDESLKGVRKSAEVVRANTSAMIDGERANLNRARGEVKNIERQLLTVQSRIARQRQQNVYAPTDGTIFRVLENGEAGGQLVNPGQRLANLVPEVKTGMEKDRETAQVTAITLGLLSATPLMSVAGTPHIGAVLSPPQVLNPLTRGEYPGIVCELFIDGNDLPLVRTGDATILQFEGWPAVQFVGVPEAAAGTFRGRVYLIDPTSNERGQFRILIEPDPEAEPWPNQDLLRQGVRAQGWVLMPTRVRLGWELWRQVNGFPPFRETQSKTPSATAGPVQRK